MEVEIITSLIPLSKTQSHDYIYNPGWKIWFFVARDKEKDLVNIFLHFYKDLECCFRPKYVSFFLNMCISLNVHGSLCIWITLLIGAFLHIYLNLFQNSVLLSACILSLCACLNMEHGSFWYTILSSIWKNRFF